MGVRGLRQPRLVAAATAAAGALLLALVVDPGVAPAGDSPEQATTSVTKRFCKKHPRRPRCRRLRIRVSWDDDANIDLYVWDPALRMASPFSRFAIPRAVHSGDTGVLPEKFFDRKFTPRRHFAFGVCLRQEPAFDPTVYTVTYRRPDGTTFTDTDELFDRGQSVLYLDDGVPDPDPSNSGAWCPA